MANGSLLLRLAILVLLFFGIEIIYGKWQDPQLNFGEEPRRFILYIYTLVQILIVIRFIYEFRNFIWGEKAAKVVEAKKSLSNLLAKLYLKLNVVGTQSKKRLSQYFTRCKN